MTALRAMVREALNNSQANGFNPHDEPYVIEWLTDTE